MQRNTLIGLGALVAALGLGAAGVAAVAGPEIGAAVRGGSAPAQPATPPGPPPPTDYQPQVGQEGKDVIWVPTPDELVAEMLKVAKVTKDDFVVDLGSGDGKIAIAAARDFGARAKGIEYNPDMVKLSNRRAYEAGVQGKVSFIEGDIFKEDFTNATVVTMYLLPSLNLKLRPQLLEMKPGTRLVSHAFTMGSWEPDQTVEADGRQGYLWIVPANVQGTWSLDGAPFGSNARLELTQRFQKVTGEIVVGGKRSPIDKGRLDGARFTFDAPDASGRVRSVVVTVDDAALTGEGGITGRRLTARQPIDSAKAAETEDAW
jgi:SAM-dependent methyltransferase